MQLSIAAEFCLLILLQRAVQEQVEDKRRVKMEERDRKIREEREEEAKLAKERQVLSLQFEEELKKRRDKEVAECSDQLYDIYYPCYYDLVHGKYKLKFDNNKVPMQVYCYVTVKFL